MQPPHAALILSLLAAACQPAPAAVPPAWCHATAPLDASCDAPHCVAAIVVDYQRLEPRGFRVFGLSGDPVTRDDARTRAAAFLVEQRGASPPDFIDVDRAGDFFNSFLKHAGSSDEWLVVLHAETGQVVLAEPQLWANAELRGYDFPLPEGFSDASALGCTDDAAEPEHVDAVTTGAPYGSAPASTASEAWDVARRLNLAAQLGGPRYRVMVISYAPAVGEFDAASADWYVFVVRVP